MRERNCTKISPTELVIILYVIEFSLVDELRKQMRADAASGRTDVQNKLLTICCRSSFVTKNAALTNCLKMKGFSSIKTNRCYLWAYQIGASPVRERYMTLNNPAISFIQLQCGNASILPRLDSTTLVSLLLLFGFFRQRFFRDGLDMFLGIRDADTF